MVPDRTSPLRRRYRLPIGAAVTLVLILAISLLIGLSLAGYHYVLRTPSPELRGATPQLFDLFKIALTVVGGTGAVVALVVAYRRQRVTEDSHRLALETADRDLARVLNERFTTAVGQLGTLESPTTQLGGISSLAALADGWPSERQRCIDVLCGYLRLPIRDTHEAYGDREVRQTVARLIRDRLRRGSFKWEGDHLFDLSGAELSGLDFSRIHLDRARLRLSGARVSDGCASFDGLALNGGVLECQGIHIDGGQLSFVDSRFATGTADFRGSTWSHGALDFTSVGIKDADVDFTGSIFSGASLQFRYLAVQAVPTEHGLDAALRFDSSLISGGALTFHGLKLTLPQEIEESFNGPWDRGPFPHFEAISFRELKMAGGCLRFEESELKSASLEFSGVEILGGEVIFENARIRDCGIRLDSLEMSGGQLRFANNQLGVPGSDMTSKWRSDLDQSDERRETYNAHPIAQVTLIGGRASGGDIRFESCTLSAAFLEFYGLELRDANLSFNDCTVTNSVFALMDAQVEGKATMSFDDLRFFGGVTLLYREWSGIKHYLPVDQGIALLET